MQAFHRNGFTFYGIYDLSYDGAPEITCLIKVVNYLKYLTSFFYQPHLGSKSLLWYDTRMIPVIKGFRHAFEHFEYLGTIKPNSNSFQLLWLFTCSQMGKKKIQRQRKFFFVSLVFSEKIYLKKKKNSLNGE